MSVSIGQPGFYGRLNIGGYPQPPVIYNQPRVVRRGYEEREPIYMRVPPGHAKNWSKHCQKYNACNERVYFVQDNWYNHEFAPRYEEQHHDQRNDYPNEHSNKHRSNDRSDHYGNEHGKDKN